MEKELYIQVIDAIMGSGKTRSMIDLIKRSKKLSPNEKHLIVVPYLKEVDRYTNELNGFYGISDNIKGSKSMYLEKLLKDKKDIVCTHDLFLLNPNTIIEHAQKYVLVIDEAINSLIDFPEFPQLINTKNLSNNIKKQDKYMELKPSAQTYSFNRFDIDIMLKNKILLADKKTSLDIGRLLHWNEDNSTETIYSCLKDYFDNNNVYQIPMKNEHSTEEWITSKGYTIPNPDYKKKYIHYYISLFKIEVFQTFRTIYIMTYLWSSQKMYTYFNHYCANITFLYPVEVITANGKDYILSSVDNYYRKKEKAVKLHCLKNINIPGYIVKNNKFIRNPLSTTRIYDYKFKGTKENIIFSYSFYNAKIHNPNNEYIFTQIKKNIENFIKSIKGAKKKNVLWTVYKNAQEIIQEDCMYINNENFLAINTKATNEYSNKNILIYLIDRFMNPYMQHFLEKNTFIPPTNEGFALSELIQWIWRSAIRNDMPIHLYIASENTLNLFIEWVNDYSDSNFIDKKFIKEYEDKFKKQIEDEIK